MSHKPSIADPTTPAITDRTFVGKHTKNIRQTIISSSDSVSSSAIFCVKYCSCSTAIFLALSAGPTKLLACGPVTLSLNYDVCAFGPTKANTRGQRRRRQQVVIAPSMCDVMHTMKLSRFGACESVARVSDE